MRTVSNVRSVVSGLAIAAIYGVIFWRILKTNRGNRVIECGIIALIVAFSFSPISKIPNLPEWVLPTIGLLLFLLCVLTMFFLFMEGVQALRNRKAKAIGKTSRVNE